MLNDFDLKSPKKHNFDLKSQKNDFDFKSF